MKTIVNTYTWLQCRGHHAINAVLLEVNLDNLEALEHYFSAVVLNLQ